jgi:hypothetical protein
MHLKSSSVASPFIVPWLNIQTSPVVPDATITLSLSARIVKDPTVGGALNNGLEIGIEISDFGAESNVATRCFVLNE